MSQFENSEVMIKYAALINTKTAADYVDYAQELATGIPIGLAGDLAVGAALTYGSAAMLPGVGLAGAGSFVAGTKLLALLGGPVGIVLGVAAAVGFAIWQASKMADDNIKDLISRLDALDPDNAGTKAFIDGWIANLNAFKSSLALVHTHTDPRKRALLNRQKLDSMTKLHAYLARMQTDWPRLEARLTDWAFDPGQAKTAIDKTLVAMTQGLEKAKLETRNAVQEFIAAAGKEKQKRYPEIAEKIQEMWQELTKIDGAPPTFDSIGEKVGYDLAANILAGKVTVSGFEKGFNNMISLHRLLELGINQAKQQEKGISAMTSQDQYLLKMSLTRGNGQMITIGDPRTRGKARKTKPRGTKQSHIVKGLQKAINKLNYAYNAGAGTIEEDGIYGPITADALVGVLSSDWRLSNMVAQNAKVNYKAIQNVKMMRQNPNQIRAIYRILSPMAEKIKGPVSGHGVARKTKPRDVGISQRDVNQPGGMPSRRTRCRWNDLDVTDHDEVIACLQEFKVKDKRDDEWYDAYSWLRSLGIRDEKVMVKLITKQFPPETMKPSEWGAKIFTEYVGNLRGGAIGGSALL